MCSGCELNNGERIRILDNSATDFDVYLENHANRFRLHMTNERNHTVRDIYYCPFCGRKLNK